jgi:cell division protease FtsH
LAQQLIDREVIFMEDMEHIFGKRPWTSRADELMSELDANVQVGKENKISNVEESKPLEENNTADDQTTNDEIA